MLSVGLLSEQQAPYWKSHILPFSHLLLRGCCWWLPSPGLEPALHEQGAWRWPLGSAAGVLVSCCAPPSPSRSAGKLGLCRVQRALDPHRKAEGSNTGSATSLCGLEDMHLALMNHSFLLCKMRAAVKIDEIRCMLLAQGLLHRGCPSSIAWIWIWYWHCWLNTWTMSIALRPGLCTFVKLLLWSGFPLPVFHWNCSLQGHQWITNSYIEMMLWISFLKLSSPFGSSPVHVLLPWDSVVSLSTIFFLLLFSSLHLYLDSSFLSIGSYRIML